MLRKYLYSKDWQRRYLELIERGMELEEFYVDLCEGKAMGMNYCGKPIDEILKSTEDAVEYNRKQIEKHKSMTLIEKMRYKG